MLIDLGEEWESPVEPEAPHWTSGWRSLAVLAALVPALVLTSAAPRPAPALVVRANLELGTSEELIEFSGNEIIVRDGRVVTVYEPDGRKRWHASLSSVNEVFFRVDVDRGRVLAMAQRMQVPRTVAFDLASGARVWEFEGWADMLDDLIFVTSIEGGDFAVYDARTLEERWSVRELAAHSIDTDSRTLVALEKDGRIGEYRLATGELVRAGRIDVQPALNYGLNAWDDLITIFYEGATDSEPRMLSFDRRTYAPRPGELPQFGRTERQDCGPVVCEMAFDGGQVSVVDSASGKLLWRARSGASLMGTPAGLFAFPQFEAAQSPPELLEPRTGRRLASLEGWQPIMLQNRVNAAPLVLRQVHTTGTEGQTFIGGFDRRGLRVLGSVPHIIYTCQYADWVLACVTGDRRLLVIEIDSGALAGVT